MASMSAVGKIGAMLLQGGHGRSRYRGRMRRLLSTLFRAALIVGALAVVRAVLLDRAPRRELAPWRAGHRQPRHVAGRAAQAAGLTAAATA